MNLVGSREMLAIDWDVRTVRIVQARVSKRKQTVLRALAVQIPDETSPTDALEMGQLIRRSLDQEGISTRHAIVDVPRDQVILHTLKLPPAGVNELAGMVGMQIGRELPFPLSEAIVDFAAQAPRSDASLDGSGEETKQQLEVLVAAARNEVIEFYASVCRHAGLIADRIGLRPYANMTGALRMLGDDAPQRVLLVDVGPGLSEIDVIRDGRLNFSRAASVMIPKDFFGDSTILKLPEVGDDDRDSSISDSSSGPTSSSGEQSIELDLGADEESPSRESLTSSGTRMGLSSGIFSLNRKSVVKALTVEVTRSVEAYRAKDAGASMDVILISGDTGVEDQLAESVQERFGARVMTYNPGPRLGWPSERGAGASAFCAAIGLVYGHAADARVQFNFLSPKKPVSASAKQLQKAPVAAAIAVLFVGAVFAFWYQVIRPQNEELALLDEAIALVETELKELGEFESTVIMARNFDRPQVVFLDEIVDVLDALPPARQILLERIDMSEVPQGGWQIRLDYAGEYSGVGLEAAKRLTKQLNKDGGVRVVVDAGDESRKESPVHAKYPYEGRLIIGWVTGGRR
jgi:type IV pilus assembly protein PilM